MPHPPYLALSLPSNSTPGTGCVSPQTSSPPLCADRASPHVNHANVHAGPLSSSLLLFQSAVYLRRGSLKKGLAWASCLFLASPHFVHLLMELRVDVGRPPLQSRLPHSQYSVQSTGPPSGPVAATSRNDLFGSVAAVYCCLQAAAMRSRSWQILQVLPWRLRSFFRCPGTLQMAHKSLVFRDDVCDCAAVPGQ